MNRRDERRAEKTVEKQLRRSSKEQERTLRRQKAENADDRSAIRERYRKKSAARMEKKSMFRTMIVSTVIIFCAFLFFELLLFIVSGDGGDLNTHLLTDALQVRIDLVESDTTIFDVGNHHHIKILLDDSL